MTLPDLLLPTYLQMLGALSAWLAKAEAQRSAGGEKALLGSRLAPDMFPLATQVRFACVQAQEGVFRLQGRAFPPSLQALLDEGRTVGERPGTIADARARIAETVAVVEAAAAEGIEIDPATPIAQALPIGMTFDPNGGAVWARLGAATVLFPRDDRLRNPASSGHRPRQGRLRLAHVCISAAAYNRLT